jgi:hypothetical protein
MTLNPNQDGPDYPAFYPVVSVRNTVTSLAYVHTGVDGVASYDGSTAAVTVGTQDLFRYQMQKIGISWGNNDHRMFIDGVGPGTDAFDGSFDSNTDEIRIGWYNTGNQLQAFFGSISNLVFYKKQLPDSLLQGRTL